MALTDSEILYRLRVGPGEPCEDAEVLHLETEIAVGLNAIARVLRLCADKKPGLVLITHVGNVVLSIGTGDSGIKYFRSFTKTLLGKFETGHCGEVGGSFFLQGDHLLDMSKTTEFLVPLKGLVQEFFVVVGELKDDGRGIAIDDRRDRKSVV